MSSSPADTKRMLPGGSSSSGQTSSSATCCLGDRDLVRRSAPLRGKRRSPCLVEAHLRRAGAEEGALEAHRRQGDADLLEQLLLRHRGHVRCRAPADELGQHRRRRLADRAATTLEADVFDHVAVAEAHRDRYLVAAERVLPLRVGVARLEQPVATRVLVVVEDDLPVELLELTHPKTFLTLCRPSTRRSISSGIV